MASTGVRITQLDESTPFSTYEALFSATADAFGNQTRDLLWRTFNPDWDKPEGIAAGAARVQDRVKGSAVDKDGRPAAVVLAGSIKVGNAHTNDVEADGEDGWQFVGLAIWAQLTTVPGEGAVIYEGPVEGRKEKLGVEKRFPESETMQLLLCKLDAGLHTLRDQALREIAKEGRSPPAAFTLDLCAVRPDAQGKGVAKALVRWGLDEAERRGLECMTEASMMGRGVYEKLGMAPVQQVEYGVDEEMLKKVGLTLKDLPDNVFMRTRPQSTPPSL